MRAPPSFGIAHLAHQVHEEQQRAIGDPRQAGTEATGKALVLVLVIDLALHLLPVHAERADWRA